MIEIESPAENVGLFCFEYSIRQTNDITFVKNSIYEL